MSTLEMPRVSECTVAGCSYNTDEACHAFAVTIDDHSACGTFIPLDVKGGLPRVNSQVGACQRANCVHNQDLECVAESVKMGPSGDTAECLSFQARE